MKIDGIDISKYEAVMERGGVAALLAYPSLVEPETQEWAEHDGLEVDLDNPKLQSREIDLPFTANSLEHMGALLADLSKTGYRNIRSSVLSESWRLRYISQGSITSLVDGARSFVRFADDMPRTLFSNRLPHLGYGQPVPPLPNKYFMDGISFSDYGLIVLGAKDSIYRAPDMRESLKITNKVMDGAIYDSELAQFKGKDVVFKLSFYCDTTERLLNNHRAFFYDLIQSNERILTTDYLTEDLKFYYKSASNFVFTKTTLYTLLEFDLTLVFTNYRPSEIDILLATEIWDLVVSEDGITFIDVAHYGNQ